MSEVKANLKTSDLDKMGAIITSADAEYVFIARATANEDIIEKIPEVCGSLKPDDEVFVSCAIGSPEIFNGLIVGFLRRMYPNAPLEVLKNLVSVLHMLLVAESIHESAKENAPSNLTH